ncbi:MAG TPA: TlpA disulfide reductase family protein [Blastocatellia bacterium]|jgi:peroxiredoxin|nr:TlpA disulfide reductase family protein [Blastocatellia bacterium]
MERLLLSFLLILSACAGVMAQNADAGAVRLEGQVVCCEDCWVRADRKATPYGTRADLEKAAECVASGDPSLLAVTDSEGKFTLYELRLGKYRRPGKDWLGYVGKRVEVMGAAGKKKDKPYIKVDALTVLAPAIAESEPEVNAVGTEADLALKDLFGVEQRLSAYRGRVVVLNFWATYCVPCKKEMPDLAAIQNEYAALGVQVIGASADTMADQKKVMQFIKETKLNFPVWLGASAEDMGRFGLGSALPGTVIIGRDGKIAAAYNGIIKVADIRRRLESLLAAAEKESKAQLSSAKQTPGKASSVPS